MIWQAEDAINCITPADVTWLWAVINNPPEKVAKVCWLIYLLLFNETKMREFSDKSVKTFLVNLKLDLLKDKLQTLESVPENTIKLMKKETASDKNWNAKSMEECSSICLSFYKWINAMSECYYLKKDTWPLLIELDEKNKILASS